MWYNSGMSNTKKPKISVVPKKYGWGVYLWKLPSGKMFKDSEGNYLNVPAMKGDIAAIGRLRDAAKYYGEPEGEPFFRAGVSRVSDEEYSEQLERLKDGQIPSLNDMGAVYDAQQGLKQHGDDMNA